VRLASILTSDRFLCVVKLGDLDGLLGGIASPDGGKDSLLFASGCGPVRFDLDYSLFSSQIVMEAAP